MTKGFIKKKYNRLYISMLMSWTVCLVGSLSDSILGGSEAAYLTTISFNRNSFLWNR